MKRKGSGGRNCSGAWLAGRLLATALCEPARCAGLLLSKRPGDWYAIGVRLRGGPVTGTILDRARSRAKRPGSHWMPQATAASHGRHPHNKKCFANDLEIYGFVGVTATGDCKTRAEKSIAWL